MSIRNFYKNKSFFHKWLFSYLIIIALIMAGSILIYLYAYQITYQQSYQMNSMLLDNLIIETDGEIRNVDEIMKNLLIDSDVQKVTGLSGKVALGDQETISKVHQKITNLSASSPDITDVFISLNATDTVISVNGHMSSRLFYDLYFDSPYMSFEEFKELLRKKWRWNSILLDDKSGGQQIVFLQTSLNWDGGKDTATIGVTVSNDKLKKRFSEAAWDQGTKIFAINKENYVLGGELPTADEGDKEYKILDSDSQVKIEGIPYQLVKRASSVNDWVYFILTPISAIQKNARSIQLFTAAVMGVCVVLGIFTAWKLSVFYYHPLKKLMNIFGTHNIQRDGNEYQWLAVQAKKLKNENKNAARILKNQYLYRLITRGATGQAEAGYLSAFTGQWNLVLMFEINEMGEQENGEKNDLSQFIVSNIFTEVAEKSFHTEYVDLGEMLVCILNLQDIKDDSREQVEAVIYQTQERILEWFQIRLRVFAGSFEKGLDGIHLSYMNAGEAEEYRDDMSNMDILWYEDISNRQMIYEYSLAEEQKIINTVQIGDEKSAGQWIRQVLEENRERSVKSKSYLMQNFLSTLMRGAQQGGVGEQLQRWEQEHPFSHRQTIEQMEQWIFELLHEICQEIGKKQQEKGKDQEFGKKVLDYVKDNFQNPDLNISMIALHFHITPTYLSLLFKEQIGGSLLEQINTVRVEKAKSFLLEGRTVAEVAEKTGFRNSNTFIRVFKKMTGITPGQLKNKG